MVDKVLYVPKNRYEDTKTLSSDLGYAAWNAAIYNAPKDTGNLRASITLVRNTPNLIHIRYNAFFAMYVYYLEEGIGFVTKHAGFIKNRTVPTIVSLVESSLVYDTLPSFSYRPSVTKGFTNRTFGVERRFMREAGIQDDRLSLSGRRAISKMRMTDLRRQHGKSIPSRRRGQLPMIANRATGELRQVQAQDRKLNTLYNSYRRR